MIPSETHASVPSANGDLINRVQQLRLADQLGAAKRSGGNSWLPWVLCALLAASWVGVGTRWYRSAAIKPDEATVSIAGGGRTAPTGTDATPIAPNEIVLQLKGNLTPFLQINLSPIDIAGQVTEIRFKEGDRVKKGQTLALIQDTRYRNEFNTAVATHKAAVQRYEDLLPRTVRPEEKLKLSAQIREAEAIRTNAEQQYELVLSTQRQSSGAQQDVFKTRADLTATAERVHQLICTFDLLIQGEKRQRVLAAEADVAAAHARLEEARRLLDNCTVNAPIDGIILTKAADKGTLVNPVSFNVASGICSLADLSQLEVEVDVPERQITRVKPKLDCQIAADADSNRVYRGYVDRVMPIADDSKNVIKVRVRVILPRSEVPGSFLKPKMSVVVTALNRPFAPEPNDQPWE